jgi:hypothetical protein
MHRWRVRNLDASVRAFVEHLLECTKLVDAFIESELKRLADEALPPWRACSKEEASAHPERCEIFIGQWFPCNGKNIPDYRHRNGDSFRTRAPKAEPRHVSVVTVEVDGVRKFTLRPGTWAMISASIGGQWMLNATGTDDSVIIGDRLIGELSYCGGTGESEQG